MRKLKSAALLVFPVAGFLLLSCRWGATQSAAGDGSAGPPGCGGMIMKSQPQPQSDQPPSQLQPQAAPSQPAPPAPTPWWQQH